MSPTKKNEKRRPANRPGRLFEIFDENVQIDVSANLAAPTSTNLHSAVVVAGLATPPDSQATVTDAESAISEDDVDALPPGDFSQKQPRSCYIH